MWVARHVVSNIVLYIPYIYVIRHVINMLYNIKSRKGTIFC